MDANGDCWDTAITVGTLGEEAVAYPGSKLLRHLQIVHAWTLTLNHGNLDYGGSHSSGGISTTRRVNLARG